MPRLLHLRWLFHLQACSAPVQPLLPIGAGRNRPCLSPISTSMRIFNSKHTRRCVPKVCAFVGNVVDLILSQWLPFLASLVNPVPELESAHHAGHIGWGLIWIYTVIWESLKSITCLAKAPRKTSHWYTYLATDTHHIIVAWVATRRIKDYSSNYVG